MIVNSIYSCANQVYRTNKPRSAHQNFEISRCKNSGFSFEQSNALKNLPSLNKLSFRGKIYAPSFDNKDVEIIQELLTKCRYGKRDLIYGDISKVKLIKTKDGFSIENFYTKDDREDGTITGICEELANKIGQRLKKILKDKYLIFTIQGANREFPGGHSYLGMLNNTKNNNDIIESLIEAQNQISKQYNDFFNTNIYKEIFPQLRQLEKEKKYTEYDKLLETEKGKLFLEEFEKRIPNISNLKRKLEAFNASNIKDCLLIDPSFNRVQQSDYGDLFSDYSTNYVANLKPFGLVEKNLRPIATGMPLGYVKDIVPEFAHGANENGIIIIYPMGNKIITNPTTHGLSKDHPLIKFLNKLNENFEELAI